MCAQLEAHYRDLQDIEFTIDDGRLWMLQTRSGKRTIEAAIRIAVDMAEEGLLSREEAVLRVEAGALDQLLHPTIDAAAEKDVIATGLPASPGAAAGEIVFDADEAEALKAKGRQVILVRMETSPEDIHGMHAAVGILTARGGMTSHAAVVARGMGRPCICGADAPHRRQGRDDDGRQGGVPRRRRHHARRQHRPGAARPRAMRQPQLSGAFAVLMTWADSYRRLGVRRHRRAMPPRRATSARRDRAVPHRAHVLRRGALLRVREMICADDEQARRAALAALLPMQRGDFVALFETWPDCPSRSACSIRRCGSSSPTRRARRRRWRRP